MNKVTKKILILSASPRIHGNSDTLADEFMLGATKQGHHVEKIVLQEKQINYCIGCMTCMHTARCFQQDDMNAILDKMIEADCIVLATPVYFYTMNAQMKTLIDRTVPRYTQLSNKDYYIIMSAAEENQMMMKHVIDGFQGFFDCLDNYQLKGVLYGLGLNDMQDVQTSKIKEEAYQMGYNI